MTGSGGASGSALVRPDARLPPDTSPAPPPAAFTAQLGSWTFVDGTTVITCPVSGPSSDTLAGGGFDLQRGTDAPLHYLAGGCTWKLEGSGTTATFRPGQICTDTSDSGTRYQFTVVFGRLTFGSPRAVLDLELSLASSDLPYSCNMKLSGGATKDGGGLVY